MSNTTKLKLLDSLLQEVSEKKLSYPAPLWACLRLVERTEGAIVEKRLRRISPGQDGGSW